MFQTIIIKIQKINIFCENFNKLQEFAVFYDYKAINILINTISWIFVIIQFQNYISIWHIDIIIAA